MNPMINELVTGLNSVGQAFCEHAAGVFVQTAILVVVLYAVDLLLRKRVRAVFRYCVWLLVLVKLILPPTLSLPTGIGYWASGHVPSSLNASGSFFDVPGLEFAGELPEGSHAGPSKGTAEAGPPITAAKTPLPDLTWKAILFILWVMGVFAFLALLVQRAVFVRGLIAASTPANAEFAGVLEQCRRQIGVRLKTKLRISETISSPAVCGFFRPIILIPAALVDKLSPEGLRAILIHELAHIKRGDLWVNSIQTFLQVVYFYNPFVWFANSMIRKVCEEAVDETVLVTLGGKAKGYSNTLIDIGEMAFWKADLGLRLIGVAESKKALQWRIRHMLTRPIPKTSKLGFVGVATVIFIAAILLPMSRAEKVKPATETIKTDAAPTFVKMWPELPESSWYFYGPSSVAVDSSGNVYVTEAGNHRIQKFTSDGTFITKWGSRGSGEGQLISPRIALDASGNVYVTDNGNNRIQKFNSEGDFIMKWGNKGSGDGEFKTPMGVAVDESGNVYVADAQNHRIQKFTSNGKFITKWGRQGSGDGEFKGPRDIVLDATGNVYVLDRNNHRIQKFTSEGDFIMTWGSKGSGSGQFHGPRGVAVDRSGNVYVTEVLINRIQKFTPEGDFIEKWGSSGNGDGKFCMPSGLTTDNSGNVYVADTQNHRIQKFNSEGSFITKWGAKGSGDGEFKGPWGVAVDKSGNVYVGDMGNNRIQKFASNGTFITKWGRQGNGDGEFKGPLKIALDASDNVYVLERNNPRIQKFTSDGHFITKWGAEGSGDGEFKTPIDIGLDAVGNVYVADILNNRIQKFTSNGKFITQWGGQKDEDGQFWPLYLAVDDSGNVYVNANDQRIHKFTSEGHFVVKWGSGGSGEGQFKGLCAIAVDKSGNIYVADTSNNRIQKFSSSR